MKSLPQTLGLRRESSYFLALKLPETDNVLAERCLKKILLKVSLFWSISLKSEGSQKLLTFRYLVGRMCG